MLHTKFGAFLGAEKESAAVAYMKVAQRRAAVQMHQFSGPGEQAGSTWFEEKTYLV